MARRATPEKFVPLPPPGGGRKRPLDATTGPTPFTDASIQRLQSRMTLTCNRDNRHPREDRIRFDGENGRHDYYIDGHNVTKLKWISGSKFPEVFFAKDDMAVVARNKAVKDNKGVLEIERTRPGQDALLLLVKEAEEVAATAKALATQHGGLLAMWHKTHTGAGAGKLTVQGSLLPLRGRFDTAWEAVATLAAAAETTIQQHAAGLRVEWDGLRDLGTANHKLNEKFLSDPDNPWRPGDPRPCHGFLAWLDAHAHFDVYRTEITMFDEEIRVMGSADALFRRRCPVEPGVDELELYDYKFTKDEDLGTVWPSMTDGTHPTTAHLKNTKLAKYSLQLLLYAWILRRRHGLNIVKIVILQFRTPAMTTWKEYVVMDDPERMEERIRYIKETWPSEGLEPEAEVEATPLPPKRLVTPPRSPSPPTARLPHLVLTGNVYDDIKEGAEAEEPPLKKARVEEKKKMFYF